MNINLNNNSIGDQTNKSNKTKDSDKSFKSSRFKQDPLIIKDENKLMCNFNSNNNHYELNDKRREDKSQRNTRVKTTKNANRSNNSNMSINKFNSNNNIDNPYKISNELNENLNKSKQSTEEVANKESLNRSHFNSFSLVNNENFLLKSNKSSFAESNVHSRESTSSLFVSSSKFNDNFKSELGKLADFQLETESSRQTLDKTKRKGNKFKSAKSKKNNKERTYKENSLDVNCFEV